MTIKIERDAFLYVIDGVLHSSSSNYQGSSRLPPSDGDGDLVVYSSTHGAAISVPSDDECESIPKSSVSLLRRRTTPTTSIFEDPLEVPDLELLDDDTVSSCSSGGSFVSEDRRRSVSFASPLVTEVRTRPRTLPEDLRTLFYSYDETQR